MKAYRDTWGRGLDCYLEWFATMAVPLLDLLAETGSLYVHVDPGVVALREDHCWTRYSARTLS